MTKSIHKLAKFADPNSIRNRLTKPAKPTQPPHPRDAWKAMSAKIVPTKINRVAKNSLLRTNTVPAPDSLADMAFALKNNVDLIYEWVYSNVDFFPMWGLHKGAFGALVDRVGGSFEQASLMIALLKQSGYTANFVAGTIRLTKSQIENLLGSDASVVADASEELLLHGQIPFAATYSGGTLQYIDMDHVWVQVEIDGINYEFDPSLKLYQDKSGIDIGAILNFNETSLIAAAQNGATVTSDYVQNFNTNNVHTAFTDYSTILLDSIKQNNFDAGVDDIVGGRSIIPLPPGTMLRQASLPYQTPGIPKSIWNEIPDNYRAWYEVILYDSEFNIYFDETVAASTPLS